MPIWFKLKFNMEEFLFMSFELFVPSLQRQRESALDRTISAGDIFRHFKGGLYEIVCVALNTETSEDMVIYKSISPNNPRCEFGKIYARPKSMFLSVTDFNKYPEATQIYRFLKMNPNNPVLRLELSRYSDYHPNCRCAVDTKLKDTDETQVSTYKVKVKKL